MDRESVPLKCVVVGDKVPVEKGACNKTHLLVAYIGMDTSDHVPTVFDNYTTDVELEGKSLSVGLFDTTGQEEYERCRVLTYPHTDVFILCFSFTCPASLDNVINLWYPELKRLCPDTPIILVGTEMEKKEDPETINRLEREGLSPILSSQGREMKKKIRAARYLECSSSEGENVNEVFQEAIRVALKHHSYTRTIATWRYTHLCAVQ